MKSILVIGVNRLGTFLVKHLHEQGHQIMAVDRNEKRINNIMPYVTDAQIGDSTDENFLRSLGVNNYDVCVVTIVGDFQSSLETTSLLKELGAKMVISRAERDVQEKFLLRNGADEVINPVKQNAEWAAIRYGSNHVLDYIKIDDDHAIFEVPTPKAWEGKSIGKIDIQLAVYDSDSYERLITGEPVEIRTSDYGNNWQKEPIGQVVYDDNGLVIIYLEPQLQESFVENYYQFNFCFQNSTDTNLRVECETFIIDGNEIDTWIYKPVPAGKKALDYGTMFQSDLDQFGIETPQTLEVIFSVSDSESFDELFSTGSIVIDLS